jgi:hypothetical protein
VNISTKEAKIYIPCANKGDYLSASDVSKQESRESQNSRLPTLTIKPKTYEKILKKLLNPNVNPNY